MGRNRVPTALKLVTGRVDKRTTNENEPALPEAQPEPPSFLRDEALAEWQRMIKMLCSSGIMTDADMAILAGYCQMFGVWFKAEKAMMRMEDKDSINYALMVRTTNGNAIQNPLRGVANKALSDLIRYAGELGMTPVARSRVNAIKANENQEKYDKFFKR